MGSRIFISVMIVGIAVSIAGCQESQEKTQTPVIKPARTAPKIKPTVATEEERKSIVKYLLKTKMRLKNELEANLKKLREDGDAGVVSLSAAELNYIEKNLTDAIANEEKEIEVFRTDLGHLEFTMSIVGEQVIFGTTRGGTVTLDRQKDKLVTRDKWTGKPTSEKEMNASTYASGRKALRMYRFDGEGKRYLYATYHYDHQGRGNNLTHVDILKRDGTVRERLYMNSSGMPYVIETSIGEDKWVQWPSSITFALKRIKLILEDRNYW